MLMYSDSPSKHSPGKKDDKALDNLKASLNVLGSLRASGKKRHIQSVSIEEPSYVIKEKSNIKNVISEFQVQNSIPKAGMLIKLSEISKGLFTENLKDGKESKTQLGRIVSNSQKRKTTKQSESNSGLTFKNKKPAQLSLEDCLLKDQTIKSSKSKVKQKMLQLSEEKPWMFRMDKWKEPTSTTPKPTSTINLMKADLAHRSKLTLSPKATSGFLLGTTSRDDSNKTSAEQPARLSNAEEINHQTLFILKIKEQLNEVMYDKLD